jgi:hypothetical protein
LSSRKRPQTGLEDDMRSTEMANPQTDPKPESERKPDRRGPPNPSDPTGGHRQELDPKRDARKKGGEKRDAFPGEKMPDH